MRHRLRFLLQELDLPPGETLIGRSSECLLTLEDPLVSRRHARVIVQGETASFEDLGSRNGSRINGHRVKGLVRLEEGDRIRLGGLEFIYCTLPGSPLVTRLTTERLRTCGECPAVFPAEIAICPNCGSLGQAEEALDVANPEAQYDWALYLLTELSVDSIAQGQMEVAEQFLRVGLSSIDAHLATGHIPRVMQLDTFLEALLLLMGKGGGTVALLERALEAYARRAQLPSLELTHTIANLPAESLVPLATVIDDIVVANRSRENSWPSDKSAALETLEGLLHDFERWKHQ